MQKPPEMAMKDRFHTESRKKIFVMDRSKVQLRNETYFPRLYLSRNYRQTAESTAEELHECSYSQPSL